MAKWGRRQKKITKQRIEDICENALKFVKDNKNILFFVEVKLFVKEQNKDIAYDTIQNMFAVSHERYSKYTILGKTKKQIMDILEMRLLKDKEIRHNIQNLVLGTKYKYGERKSVENTHDFKQMPTIKVKGKEKEIKIGDED